MMLRRLCVGAFFLAFLALLPASGSTLTVTNTNDSGSGSLRAALAAAAPGDTINFNVTSPATITLASSLTVSTNVTITGPGASNLALSGNNAVQVLYVPPAVTVSISGLTIENGNASSGGGVSNSGTLTLSSTVLTNNSGSLYGGAVYNSGGTLNFTNSTIANNSAFLYGGAIYNVAGTVALNGSTVSGNSVYYYGGGIYNDDGVLNLTNSTLAGNSSNLYAGAIWNADTGTTTATSSTFYGNKGGYSSAISNSYSTVTLKNSLLAGNTGGNYMSFGGTAVSNGYNLSDDSSAASFLTSTGDQNGVGAGLDTNGLQDNGGPTKTVALVSGSPAVDAVPVAACTWADGATPLTSDQRGVTRPQGAACDIGAFELAQTAVFSSFTAKLDIHGGSQGAFDLNATFTLAAGSSGIDPLTQAVQLQLGSFYNVTIPAGSFHQLAEGEKQGSYVFAGMINGTWLAVQIVPLGGNSYQFKAAGAPVDFSSFVGPLSAANPVNVTLTIDKNTGTTAAQSFSPGDNDWNSDHPKRSKHDHDSHSRGD